VIFTLLIAVRHGIERRNIWREFRRQGVALRPRLSFWVAVCTEAGLLRHDTERGLRITSFASQWIKRSADEQMFHLIEAWQNAPKNKRVRLFRKKLLWKLKYNKPLTKKDQGALNGLDALGLTEHGKLTKWGEFFIKDEGELPSPRPLETCQIHDNQFIAHLPVHLELLWDLERFLRPKAPGIYPLTKKALHFLDGDPHVLIELLEHGLGKPVPDGTKAAILNQPSIRVMQGIVLEFSSPSELKQLRRQPVFRKYIDRFLSPQRVLISEDKAKALFKILARRGAQVHLSEDLPKAGRKRTHFPHQPASFMRPVGKSVSKMSIIERYQDLGLALDILYRVPGYQPERRRITPLLVEERGGQTYVIAHCQTRRAQRTFRLDRIEIPGTWRTVSIRQASRSVPVPRAQPNR